MKAINYSLLALTVLFTQCSPTQETTKTTTTTSTTPVAQYKPITTTYTLLSSKDSIKNFAATYNEKQQAIILAANRVDAANIVKLDAVIIPQDLTGDVNQYTPYPQTLPFLKDIKKMVFFSYPTQYFAAYENGTLVRSGPTNMGREKDPTPTGLFYANWKAEETKSTFNDEWELKWNFNVENKLGVGWHQYALPGYPASHSCLRLGEADAKYLYDWADQWTVKGKDEVLANGTPLIIFGAYPFGSAKPWLQLAQNPHAMDIAAEQLQKECSAVMNDIKAQEEKRATQKVASK